MSTIVSVAGSSYSVPQEGDSGWATDVTNLLIQLATATKVLQVSSSSFPLLQDLSFGTSFGLKSLYIKSQATNPSATGIVRLGNAEAIGWRNAGNTADLSLTVNASNILQFNGSSVLMPGLGSIVNADINASAAIAYSKLNLTGTILNADLAGSIAYSKLVLTNSVVNADISTVAAIAYSKLALSNSIVNADIGSTAAIAYSKLNLSTSIVNADISASAAIALSKLAALALSKVVQTNAATGALEASAVTNTELSYVSGVTSAIQTQLNAKDPLITATTSADYYRGDKTFQPLNKAAVALSNVDNTSDATKNSAVAILTNKDIDGGTASNTSRITLPKAAKTTLDALTRKQGTIAFDTTSGKPYYDDGTNLQLIGSGSGGSVNFVSNPDAEAGVTGWTVDSFAAAARPSGALTGVSTGVTFTASSTVPLAGSNSFILTKDAVNRQGRVVYTGITITPAYFAKVVQITADYLVNSGTFVAGDSTTDSDVIFYLQNVTDGTFIEPSSFKLLSNSTTISDRFSATFQTAAAATSYRLLIYVASTSAAAYSLKLDNISVSPSVYVYGTPITDWQRYVPAYTNLGTVTSSEISWRRVGDSIELMGSFVTGTPVAATCSITLPAGLTVDNVKMSANGQQGDWIRNIAAASNRKRGKLMSNNSTTNLVYFTNDDYATTGSPFTPQFGAALFAPTELVAISYLNLPILGWSSSVQMSDSTDTRVVATKATLSATSAAFTTMVIGKVPINSAVSDKTGMLDTTNNRFNIYPAGDYDLAATLAWSASAGLKLLSYRVNGGADMFISTITGSDRIFGAALIPNLKSGDYVEVWGRQDSGGNATITAGEANTAVSLSRKSGPSAIAASESVNLQVGLVASQAVGAGTVVKYDTKIEDSHGSYSTVTGLYTFQSPGKYRISVQATGGSISSCVIQKNSVNSGYLFTLAAVNYVTSGSTTRTFKAGDTLGILFDSAVTLSAATSPHFFNFLSIEKVGN